MQGTEDADLKRAMRRVLGGTSMVGCASGQRSGAIPRRWTMRRRHGHTHLSLRGGAIGLLLIPVGVFALLSGVFLAAVSFSTPSSAATAATKRIAVPPTHTGTRTLAAGTPGMDFGGEEANIWHMTYTQQRAVFARVKAAGAQWIRWTVPMTGEETAPGRFHWYTAQELRAAVAAGLKVDVLLTESPTWAATKDGSPSASDFGAFAKAAVAEFTPLGISTFEIWNEENDRQSWGRAFKPAEYAAVLRASYAAIKGADANAEVLVGGMAAAPDAAGGTSYQPVTFLTQMYAAGAKGSFDAVADHPYSFPDLPQQTAAWNPFTYLPTLHQIMVNNGDGSKQIWLTEYGAPTSGVTRRPPHRHARRPLTSSTKRASRQVFQAESIIDAFTWAHLHSWVGPLFVFDWQSSPYDRYGHYGIHNANGTPTPAASAFSTVAAAYAG